MERITDAFAWPTRDPEWVSKVLLNALILVIPILGAISAMGWMLATLDNLRRGDERLAPADFSHLERGARLFVVQLVYSVAIVLVAACLYVPAFLLAAFSGSGNNNPGFLAVALFLYAFAFGVSTLGSLALLFITPSFVLATDAGGIATGLNLVAVLRRSRFNLSNTLIAGLMLIAASFISSLGVVACFIGLFATAAYSFAMQAWIIRSFEMGSIQDQAKPV